MKTHTALRKLIDTVRWRHDTAANVQSSLTEAAAVAGPCDDELAALVAALAVAVAKLDEASAALDIVDEKQADYDECIAGQNDPPAEDSPEDPGEPPA